ncbi:MAG: type 4a pilus biogenesis protein PilO [Prochloraceae cyanobacterium]|nr:type 4a pilus biogenesis protein PilO [Prochloraceae cyanobacterium]
MSYSDRWASEGGEDFESNYPELFGITITPKIGGLLAALIGVLGAGYVWMSMIQPAKENNQNLQTQRQDKQQQMRRAESGETQTQISNLQAQQRDIEQLRREILALFSDEATLDTLLLDLNRFVTLRGAELSKFDVQERPSVVRDGSLGSLVDGKLKRQRIKLEVMGTYEQIENILRDVERLQSLLLITELSTQIKADESYRLKYDGNRLIPTDSVKLKTDLTVDVLLPLSREELNVEAQQKNNNKSQRK